MIFLWFSYGFPMIYPWFFYGLPGAIYGPLLVRVPSGGGAGAGRTLENRPSGRSSRGGVLGRPLGPGRMQIIHDDIAKTMGKPWF